METFYDGDLKDIWDSDLDPSESLKISTETDIHDWFLERDVKDSTVILNDKLISEALLNGTIPIKSEHSYSLNSDGDSLPNSPRSLHTKIDDMEDECYPAISLKTATSNLRHHHYHHNVNHHNQHQHHQHRNSISGNEAAVDPKCLTFSSISSVSSSVNNISNGHHFNINAGGGAATKNVELTLSAIGSQNPVLPFQHDHIHDNSSNSSGCSNSSSVVGNCHSTNIFSGINRSSNNTGSFAGLRNAGNTMLNGNVSNGSSASSSSSCSASSSITFAKRLSLQQQQLQQQQQQKQQQQQRQYLLPQKLSLICENDCDSPTSSCDGRISPGICSDIEIDESCIKDEPMSPDSSCPPSPNSQIGHGGLTVVDANIGNFSLRMANMSSFTDSDLVFETMNGCVQLTPASQNFLKSQQLILSAGTTTANSSSSEQNIIIPKFNIKSENTHLTSGSTSYVTAATVATKNNSGYGLPLTPPSSLPSDDSEGNLTPEHLLSPLSPNTTVSVTSAAGGGGANNNNNNNSGNNNSGKQQQQQHSSSKNIGSVLTSSTTAGTSSASVRRSTSNSSLSSSSSNCLHHHTAGRNLSGSGNNVNNNNSGNGTTRQPIHTPLISSQPKGSTGLLILTEEEKRTLLAEGYPIPQKLPLSKAEEKSLKKIRRKIKNKISAQESRRKKKEYMDQLERRVEILVNENNDYKKRIQSLEDSNTSLLSQLHKLQTLVNKQQKKN